MIACGSFTVGDAEENLADYLTKRLFTQPSQVFLFNQIVLTMQRTYVISAIIALFVSAMAIGGWYVISDPGKAITIERVSNAPSGTMLTTDKEGNVIPLDFTETAEKVVDAVVHIRSGRAMQSGSAQQYRQLPDPFRDFFEDFFGERYQFETPQPRQQQPDEPRMRMGSGSGVIINSNGYIVTNNHVIHDADEIEVTLSDNRTFKAIVVGTDPTTDLALLQIKAKDLPTLTFVNSDDVRIGEWVLAVGNPFSLTSTVTAGIVSAKGRNINILRERFAVESFIQTDAAINPGNSGGALVNLNGNLVGINTAIASPTGAYSGYGFAVPSNIVNKVVEDLLKYGAVQRGVLGVMIRSVDSRLAAEHDLEVTTGAYVDSLLANSAAGAAGIRVGDVIVAVDNVDVTTSPELQEVIAGHHPGDEVVVTVDRNGKRIDIPVVLNNASGTTTVAVKEHKEILSILGLDVETVSGEVAADLDIKGGVRVMQIFPGKIRLSTQMRKGFIITSVNGRTVTDVDAFVSAIEKESGGIMLEGVYEDVPGVHYYAFGMDS